MQALAVWKAGDSFVAAAEDSATVGTFDHQTVISIRNLPFVVIWSVWSANLATSLPILSTF